MIEQITNSKVNLDSRELNMDELENVQGAVKWWSWLLVGVSYLVPVVGPSIVGPAVTAAVSGIAANEKAKKDAETTVTLNSNK